MKTNVTNNQNRQTYFFKIADGYLFIRSEVENDFNKLTLGKQGKIILYSEVDMAADTLKAFIYQGRFSETYDLPKDFDYNSSCFEFVIIENAYADIHRNIKEILIKNPKSTFEDILHRRILRRKQRRADEKNKVGRQKIYRDISTGKLVGVKPENLKIIEMWEAGNDCKAIRFALNPKTKTPSQKRVEISKIKRKLREYKHLLKRKYDGK